MTHRSAMFVAAATVCARALLAQAHQHPADSGARRDSLSVMLTVLTTTSTPALNGRSRTETQVTQPMLMLRTDRAGGDVQFAAMLNAEYLTLRRGEPVQGIWGEGFIDRRHPHTVLHEVMLTGARTYGFARASLSAGKGIVPFGTDDPMVRPMTKYPVNHHLAQILERAQIIAAVRFASRVAVEAAVFNGDEPQSPTSAPTWSRFADSRAGRITLWPVQGLELQASAAATRSPEFVSGDGFDQEKFSASARWTPVRAGPVRYVLAEWARTNEEYRSRHILAYGSALLEALATQGAWSLALRFERTSRPEEERLIDPFRTAQPPNDLTIKGVTRWQIAAAQVARALPAWRGSRTSVIGAVSRAQSTPLLTPALLDPRDVIGSDRAWQVAVGFRVGVGRMAARVGRYGSAAGGQPTDAMIGMSHDH